MESDGDLIVQNGSNIIWSTGIPTPKAHGACLCVEDDGDVVIMNNVQQQIWQSNTAHAAIALMAIRKAETGVKAVLQELELAKSEFLRALPIRASSPVGAGLVDPAERATVRQSGFAGKYKEKKTG
jgi:phosphodiesterase/alkaline phosphatase D-like protein